MNKLYELFLAIFLLSACTRSATQATPASETATPAQTATVTSEPSPEPTLTATPEIDACLFGKWLIDAESLGAYLAARITTDMPVQFTIIDTSGELYLLLREDFTLRLDSKDYVLVLRIDSPDSSFNPTVLRLGMSASGSASYAVHTGALITFDQDYTLHDEVKFALNISSSSLTLAPVALTPDNFFTVPWDAESSPEYSPPGATPKFTPYDCSAESLSLGNGTPEAIYFAR